MSDISVNIANSSPVFTANITETGNTGADATIEVGTVTTGAAGTSASITNSGTTGAAVFDFTIPKGDKGDTSTIAVGTVTTGAAGTSVSVTDTGTSTDAIFNFAIPQGDKGDAATIAVGTVTTGAAESSATVTNVGTSGAAVFDFSIPQGVKGDTGDAATIAVGTVTTGAAGSSATVTNSGTSGAAVLDFAIPKGDKGDTGDSIEYTWDGTSLGIRVEGDAEYVYVDIKGATGDTGATGNGIASVALTSGTHAAGTTDTYTITFTDNTKTTFTVYNGANGEGSGDMLASTYDPTAKSADAFNMDNMVSGTTNKVYTATDQTKLFGIAESANNYTHPASHAPSIITQDASNRFVTDTEKSTWNGKAAVGSATPSTQAFGDSAASGSSAEAARVDHKHAMPATTKDKTAITGILKGDGTDVSAATAGTDYQAPATITVNADAAPSLGTISNNTEYRCTNGSITTAPTMTIASIASTSVEFVCGVIFKAPDTTAPVVTNNSGYTIKYSGQDVEDGTWTPVADTVYRISWVFDGVYLNAYVTGVA